jgi:SAM-dependent methyltransferase
VEAWAWQRSWDLQQEGFLPDREHRFAVMLNVVDALCGGDQPKVLDLAGGTGSISLRLLRRFPRADVTLLDLDPVLLHLARLTLPRSATIVSADLRESSWSAVVEPAGFDAVLTATALHWLPAERLAELYREVHAVLRPGGVFINADDMPDPGLPSLNAVLGNHDRQRREAWYAAGAVVTWEQWWANVDKDPVLGPLKVERDAIFSIHHDLDWNPDMSWHLAALRDGGFAETGLVWRGGLDAAVVGRRAETA